MRMKEFVECPNADCSCYARWDADDKEYSCGSCDARLAKVVTPNEEEDLLYRAVGNKETVQN